MNQLRGLINRFSVPLFFLLAYGWSWGCWLFVPRILEVYEEELLGAPTILTVSAIPIYIRIGYAIAFLTGTFGPAISAIILTAAIGGKAALREFFGRVVKWRVGIQYYLAAFLIPPVMMLIQFGIFIILGGKPQTNFANFSILAMLGIFVNNFFRSGGQEELGFRGFAQPKLQEKFSPATTSLIIGVLWFGWHLPLYLWMPPVQQIEQTLMFWLLVIALCFTYTWIYNRTQSILMPMLLHATFNTVGMFLATNFTHPYPSGWLIAWLSAIVPYFILGVRLVWRDGRKNKTIPSSLRQIGYESN